MHDIRWIRDDPEAFDAAMARRGVEPLSARQVIEMDAKRREAQTEAQELADSAQRTVEADRSGEIRKARMRHRNYRP